MNRLAGPAIEINPLAAGHSLPGAGRLVTDRWSVRTTPAARDPICAARLAAEGRALSARIGCSGAVEKLLQLAYLTRHRHRAGLPGRSSVDRRAEAARELLSRVRFRSSARRILRTAAHRRCRMG
jgi:hypothetical protein